MALEEHKGYNFISKNHPSALTRSAASHRNIEHLELFILLWNQSFITSRSGILLWHHMVIRWSIFGGATTL